MLHSLFNLFCSSKNLGILNAGRCSHLKLVRSQGGGATGLTLPVGEPRRRFPLAFAISRR